MIQVINSGQVGALVLLDMSAFFDTVDHHSMSDVLHHRFDKRSQMVIAGSDTPAVMKLLTGVPQESDLVPRSFI